LRGFLCRRVPRTTPPTSPAAAVTTPVTRAAFDDPSELGALAADAFADVRRADAPALRGLLREAADLLREAADLLLFEEPRLLAAGPLELRVLCLRFPDERVLAWAIAPP
jgi:hypothetical protein